MLLRARGLTARAPGSVRLNKNRFRKFIRALDAPDRQPKGSATRKYVAQHHLRNFVSHLARVNRQVRLERRCVELCCEFCDRKTKKFRVRSAGAGQ